MCIFVIYYTQNIYLSSVIHLVITHNLDVKLLCSGSRSTVLAPARPDMECPVCVATPDQSG
jgi:hypothetical protein